MNGFSLIEVSIAIAIVGMVIVATSTLLQRVSVNGRGVRDQDLALKIARHEIVSLRTSGYDALPLTGPFADTLLDSLSAGAGTVTVSDFNAKTKQVTVSVMWMGDGSISRSVVLTTLVVQAGGLP